MDIPLLRRLKEGRIRKKVALGSLVFAFLPLQLLTPLAAPIETVAPGVWHTGLVLADKAPEFLVEQELGVTIEKTISRYEEEEKQKQQKLVAERKKQTGATVQAPASVKDASHEEKLALAQKAAAQYGIPAELLVAVWKIESGMRYYTTVQSYAGAGGPFQFMPGTWRGYAVDGNGDGVKDIHNAEDAAFAAARYLAANGAAQGDLRRALLRYNNADWYVQKVLKEAGI